MKGLERIPSTDELQKAYDQLAKAQSRTEITVKQWSEWSQWCRFDPRLAEQLVVGLAESWTRLHPASLRDQLVREPWPQVAGVLFETALASAIIRREERKIFRSWAATVMANVPIAPWEQFFIGLRKVGGRQMALDAATPLLVYQKWGYLGRDLLVNKARSRMSERNVTLLSPKVRRIMRDELLSRRDRITVAEYRAALGERISARVAELDLANDDRLSPCGNTRGRFYRVRAKRRERAPSS